MTPRRAYAVLVALSIGAGLWVLSPTVDAGAISDDFLFTAMLEGEFAAPRSPLDLFNFANGSPEDVRALRRWGSVPWWAPDDFRISMLRPLSSALFAFDHAVWPGAYRAHHLHSLAWWVLLIAAVAALYRRLLPWPVAALALWTFALDRCHHGPALWLANRGGLSAIAIGVLGVLLHVRWREGAGRGPWASTACFALALAFGEWVFPIYAYLAAYELLGQRGPWQRRALALLPSTGAAVIFVAVRSALGYGATGSGVYVDPAGEPLRFVLFLAQRVPLLLGDMVLDIPAHWWDLGTPWRNRLLGLEVFSPNAWVELPGWRSVQIVLGVAAGAVAVALARWTLRRVPEGERRTLTWLLLGALLSLVPVVASFPSTRLTLGAFIGLAPAIAATVRELALWLLRPMSLPRFLVGWTLLYAIAALHLLSPLGLEHRGGVHFLRGSEAWVRGAQLDRDRIARQRVYLVTSMEFATTFYFPYMWRADGSPMPRSFYPLSAARHAMQLERVAEDSFTLLPLGGTFMETDHELMFRHEDDTMRLGQRFELDGLRVKILRLQDGLPALIRFTLDRSLDDPDVVLLAATHRGMRRLKVPAVGEKVRLKTPPAPNWFVQDHAAMERSMQKLPQLLKWDPLPALFSYEPR